MHSVRIASHGLLKADMLKWNKEEIPGAEYIQSKHIQVIWRVEFLRPSTIADLEVVGVVLFIGGTLYLNTKQYATIVYNQVIGEEVTKWHTHAKAFAKCLRCE